MVSISTDAESIEQRLSETGVILNESEAVGRGILLIADGRSTIV